jgi:hypothetical protein
MEHMRSILFVCRLALPVGALLFCGVGAAVAQGSVATSTPVDVQQACTPDAMRLCADVIPDVPKVTACMKVKHAQLSQECRVAMAGGSTGGRRTHHHYRHHHTH